MKKINFDHLAASPILPQAKERMLYYLEHEYGNPLSRHFLGDQPKEALEEARRQVAALIKADPSEIIFTSGGSESNNLALKGLARAYEKKGKHIIASPIEHHSVLHPLKNLEKQGYEISYLKVDSEGRVDPGEVERLIRPETVLVTVIYASGEIGTLEPIEEIGRLVRSRGIFFHTDAVAAAGFLSIDVKKESIDLLSLSGNIFYAPPGTGALYVRKGVKVLPLVEGGIQEKGVRAGTHNLPGIAGLGAAAAEAREKQPQWRERLTGLRDRLIDGVLKNIPDTFLTGSRTMRLPGHASFCVKYIEGESILLHLSFSEIAGTSGSTCSSEALKVSHVLDALGIDPVWAQGSCVFSLGLENTAEEVDFFVKELTATVDKLRKMSPLRQENIEQFKKESSPEHPHC